MIKEGVTGHIFESGNYESLKNAILNLWNDENKVEKMSDNCKFEHSIVGIKEYCQNLLPVYKDAIIEKSKISRNESK